MIIEPLFRHQRDRCAGVSRCRLDCAAHWITTTAPSLIYSDFGAGELASAVGRRVRMRQLDMIQGQMLLAAIPTNIHGWSRVTVETGDIALATEYVAHFELGLRFPDAIHIATARRLGLTLVSSDIRQVDAAARLGIAAINPLLTDRNLL